LFIPENSFKAGAKVLPTGPTPENFASTGCFLPSIFRRCGSENLPEDEEFGIRRGGSDEHTTRNPGIRRRLNDLIFCPTG
jgi:hypothetical protein